MYVEIHVDSPDGVLFASGKGPGPGSSETGFWVKNGMRFYLQNRTGNKPLSAENTIPKVQVEFRPR
jgi:hypothetical protein